MSLLIVRQNPELRIASVAGLGSALVCAALSAWMLTAAAKPETFRLDRIVCSDVRCDAYIIDHALTLDDCLNFEFSERSPYSGASIRCVRESR
jgi:hypothetical protein